MRTCCYFLVPCWTAVFCFHPLDAASSSSGDAKNGQKPVYIEDEDDEDEADFWFGPGYYYGIWFANENDYWQWRGNHPDYPPNRKYYNHDHPVEYHPESRPEDRPGGGEQDRFRGGGRGGR